MKFFFASGADVMHNQRTGYNARAAVPAANTTFPRGAPPAGGSAVCKAAQSMFAQQARPPFRSDRGSRQQEKTDAVVLYLHCPTMMDWVGSKATRLVILLLLSQACVLCSGFVPGVSPSASPYQAHHTKFSPDTATTSAAGYDFFRALALGSKRSGTADAVTSSPRRGPMRRLSMSMSPSPPVKPPVCTPRQSAGKCSSTAVPRQTQLVLDASKNRCTHRAYHAHQPDFGTPEATGCNVGGSFARR